MTRRAFLTALAAVLLAAALAVQRHSPQAPLSVSSWPSPDGPSRPPIPDATAVPAHTESLAVLHVIDGDTIILRDGRRVRYIGVDTPERGDPRLGGAAQQATEANRRLVAGKPLRLELDVQAMDAYGRLLAYVWASDVFVNAELLREGYARLLTIPPNVRYLAELRAAAAAGAQNRAERWRSGPAVAGAAQTSLPSCTPGEPVKGNITRAGEKIYHVPGGAFYGRTIPEECFATEADAERAGFRRSRQ